MAADGGRLNPRGTRPVENTPPEPFWGHLREVRRHALGTGPHGLGTVCVGCWPALITAMVMVADEPLCVECATRCRQ